VGAPSRLLDHLLGVWITFGASTTAVFACVGGLGGLIWTPAAWRPLGPLSAKDQEAPMSHIDQDPAAQPSSVTAAALVIVARTQLQPTYPIHELLGRTVINDDDEEIGRLEELMIERDRIAFAIISVGGFLGIGAHKVVAPFDALLIDDEEIILPGATRGALKDLTAYDAEQARSERTPLRRARKGVKDAGEVVTTFLDEPISGIVADVTDGDVH
jgi:hypothetical protein